MKMFSLLLEAVSGAGLLFHDQVHAWWNSPRPAAPAVQPTHQAPEGVYYLRSTCAFTAADGTSVRWSPGQELRTAQPTSHGIVSLTDGVNVWQVPQSAVTRDMDDAAALRQTDLARQNTARAAAEQAAAQREESARQASAGHLVSGQFHNTILDAPATRTNQYDSVVSRVGGPVYYPVYVQGGSPQATNAPVQRKATAHIMPQRPQSNRNPSGVVITKH